VAVRNAQGVLVSEEKLERDEVNNLLTWTTEASVAPDGSEDGEYTITATFVDFTGKSFTRQFSFVLDTQVPEIESVHVAIDSQPELSLDTITTLTESFSQIIVTFENTLEDSEQGLPVPSNDIDFTNTLIELTRPGSDEPIPSNVSVYSPTQLAIRFVELIEDGSYTLSITPQDIAGNTARGAVRYAFLLDTESPRITAASPLTLSEPVSYIGGDFRQFVFTIEDVGPADLFFMRYAFLLDTESPRITAPTPLVFNQRPVTYIGNALRQFQFAFTVEDIGPADLYLEEQTIEVLDASGANIPVAVTYDELTSQLYLALPILRVLASAERHQKPHWCSTNSLLLISVVL
jgi:hypothetical protein